MHDWGYYPGDDYKYQQPGSTSGKQYKPAPPPNVMVTEGSTVERPKGRMKVVLTWEQQEYLLKLIHQDKTTSDEFAVDLIKALTVHGMPGVK